MFGEKKQEGDWLAGPLFPELLEHRMQRWKKTLTSYDDDSENCQIGISRDTSCVVQDNLTQAKSSKYFAAWLYRHASNGAVNMKDFSYNNYISFKSKFILEWTNSYMSVHNAVFLDYLLNCFSCPICLSIVHSFFFSLVQ